MVYIRDAVLATIIYYDVFDYPLTFVEAYQLLINPTRVARNSEVIGEISPSDILSALDQLVSSKYVGCRNGLYFLRDRDELATIRINRNKIADQKWRTSTKLSKWLTSAPFVRALFGSGSMSLYNTEDKSDFDMFIISSPGRLYTSRIFLSAIAYLAGVLRRKGDSVAPNKFCFNHYVVDDSLKITHESLFTAQSYANLKPVFVDEKLFHNFYTDNLWINKYLYNFKPQFEFQKITVRPCLTTLKIFIEKILAGWFGDIVERIFRAYQQKRIKANPMTHAGGGRVIFTDKELEFHPKSFEATVINKYSETAKKFGLLLPAEEKDSGLN